MSAPGAPSRPRLQGREGTLGHLGALLTSLLDPRAWLHGFRLLHYFNYTHVEPRRRITTGTAVHLAPNASLQNPERISIGDRSRIGARCTLWAGSREGRIDIGSDCTFAPDVFLTASNYSFEAGMRILDQATDEPSIVVGDDVWLGTRVIVLAGVEIGSGCVVGAGAVVTRSLPPGSIAVGTPARVVATRRTLSERAGTASATGR